MAKVSCRSVSKRDATQRQSESQENFERVRKLALRKYLGDLRTYIYAANRCVACRQSKIKCSGEEPCANCRRRSVRCRFTDVKSSGLDRYVVVTVPLVAFEDSNTNGKFGWLDSRYSQVTHSRKLSVRHRQEPWAQQRGPTERRHTVVGSLPSIDADDSEYQWAGPQLSTIKSNQQNL